MPSLKAKIFVVSACDVCEAKLTSPVRWVAPFLFRWCHTWAYMTGSCSGILAENLTRPYILGSKNERPMRSKSGLYLAHAITDREPDQRSRVLTVCNALLRFTF